MLPVNPIQNFPADFIVQTSQTLFCRVTFSDLSRVKRDKTSGGGGREGAGKQKLKNIIRKQSGGGD